MKAGIIFCLLWLLPFTGVQAIEVIANGVIYPSFEQYKAAKAAQEAAAESSQPLNRPPDDDLGAWKGIGYEYSLKRIVADFKGGLRQRTSAILISPEELQARLEALLDGRKGAVMLLADPQMLRLLELDKQPPAKDSP